MKKLKIGLFIAAVVPCFVLGLFAGFKLGHVSALGVNYFDDSGSTKDNCDLGNPKPGQQESAANCQDNGVRLVVGQGEKARDSIVQIGAYFKGLPTNLTNANLPGNLKLTIYGSNFCPEAAKGVNIRDEYKNGYYANNNLPVGTTVTRYAVGIRADGSGNPINVTGEYRVAASNYCDSNQPGYNQVVNLDRADLFEPVDYLPGEYLVRIRASVPSGLPVWNPINGGGDTCADGAPNRCLGLWNGFRIEETSGGAASYDDVIGTLAYNDDKGCDGHKGNCVSVRSKDYPGPRLTYKIRFGADCKDPDGTTQFVHFYDMDYPAGEDVRVRLHDLTNDKWLSKGGSGNWQSAVPGYGDSRTLPRSNGDDSSFSFNADQGHKYVMEIMNIDPVLVFQYSTPFKGVYYKHSCNAAAANVHPEVAIGGGTVLAPGDNVTVTGKLSNESGTLNAQTTSGRFVTWYDTQISEDYTGAAGQQLVGAAQSIGTLNYNPNQTYSYNQAVGSVSGNFSFLCGRIEATPGTNTTVDEPDYSCKRIAFLPYVTVWNSDAIAGQTAAAGQVCSTANTDAGFLSWDNGAAQGWAGAGAQYAVQALGSISDFASGNGNSAVSLPQTLSFANSGAGVNINTGASPGLFGGHFGSVDGVACDYTTDIGVAPVAGPVTINTTNLANGAQQTHYVKGDVYIRGSGIFYTGSGTWANIGDIPSFKLVVEGGDIYINHSVTTLSGIFVAEKDFGTGKGGTIYTCSQTSGSNEVAYQPWDASAPGSSTYYDDCHSPLTIYGSFVAQQVRFLRTGGSSYTSASSGDTYGSSPSAEKFVYSPELWLANLKSEPGTSDSSVTGLPPVL
jgi:hypothetical protein